jgi:hypothetical protein
VVLSLLVGKANRPSDAASKGKLLSISSESGGEVFSGLLKASHPSDAIRRRELSV